MPGLQCRGLIVALGALEQVACVKAVAGGGGVGDALNRGNRKRRKRARLKKDCISRAIFHHHMVRAQCAIALRGLFGVTVTKCGALVIETGQNDIR